ncbi:hypothetical protein TrRE_jg3570 [Triparma retinervis]|uniref:Uncharacterized protein n=1 Tax=Triparma retinervis TaxID=2557542 RepID=A0A9W7FB92_9STRA|nr:hypothetical protein TrRE_jg3570 [Triparma retinervis]
MTTAPPAPGFQHPTSPAQMFYPATSFNKTKKSTPASYGKIKGLSSPTFRVETSQLPRLLLTALCMQAIFFAGSVSWFNDFLPNLVNSGTGDGFLSRALLAAGSHTSSFTVGCFACVFLRACLPTNLKVTRGHILAAFASLSVGYFLLCFLWFTAIVPKIFDVLAVVFPGSTLESIKDQTRRYDVLSASEIDHSLVASGSHTLSWLLGMIVLAFHHNIVSKRILQRLVAFTTVFSVAVTGANMRPTFMCAMIAIVTVLLLGLRSTAATKLNASTAVCITLAAASSLTRISDIYDLEKKIVDFASWYFSTAMEPNLPFCEAPFAVSPWMAQGASAIAHLPFVPSVLLALPTFAPDLMPSMDPNHPKYGRDVKAIRTMLWLQWWLQFYSSIGGHMMPNPRVTANQEVCITLAFSLLFALVKFTSDEEILSWKLALGLTVTPIIMYLTIGLMPVVFLSFFSAMFVGTQFKGAFERLTPHAEKCLLWTFVPTIAVLAVETFACDLLQNHVSQKFPWHFAFDVLFWQVVGSALDVVIISPPGKFLTPRPEAKKVD